MSIIVTTVKKIIKKMIKIKREKILIPIIEPVKSEKLLDKKIVLITGGTGGIGLAVAKAAVKCGAKVIICGTNEDKIKKYVAEIGENAKGLFLDLRNCSTIPETVNKAITLFDERRIDILINSAGFHGDWELFDFNEAMFDKVIDINLKGTYYISQLIGKFMKERNIKGHILFLSSSSSLRPAWTPYQISKWAIDGMTKGFADMLLPYGIIVNAIAPGPTSTAMVKKDNDENIFYYEQPSQRYATPEEIANLAIFMVSSMGDMIVGDTYYISGGSGTISYHR